MKKVKFLIMLLPLTLTGCAAGSGGFDVVKFVRNPFIMAIIIIATLWFAFKSRKR